MLTGRRSHPVLADPGPTEHELADMLHAACTAPDHGRLRPWRFVVLQRSARERLGAAFANARALDEPQATDEQLLACARKALRAPVIVAVLARLTDHPKIRRWEQRVAAGCAAHNLCLAATAHGYGSMWRTGWYAEHPEVLRHLEAGEDERVVGLVYLGSVPEDTRLGPRRLDTACVTWRR